MAVMRAAQQPGRPLFILGCEFKASSYEFQAVVLSLPEMVIKANSMVESIQVRFMCRGIDKSRSKIGK